MLRRSAGAPVAERSQGWNNCNKLSAKELYQILAQRAVLGEAVKQLEASRIAIETWGKEKARRLDRVAPPGLSWSGVRPRLA